ncbi:MAG: exo-alpha-sialidase [Candidatus Aminicenantes bacterium]|nr:exo-alpha-sialidase [Candidatus Aminicenantes bacterium]
MKCIKFSFILIFFFSLVLAAQQLWKPQDKRIDTGDEPGQHESWDPQMAASGDNVYVVWHDNRDGDSGIYFILSPDRGQTWWDQSVRLSAKPGPHYLDEILLPQIGVSGENIYVVWEQMVPQGGQKNIYFNHSQDGGFNWQPAVIRLDRYDQTGKISCCPQISCSGQNVYVAWIDNRNSNWDVFFNHSSDMGASWQVEDVCLNSEEAAETRDYYHKDIAAWNDNVYVVCEKLKPNKRGEIYFYYSHDGGNSWEGQPRFLARGFQPKVGCRKDHVYLVWYDKNTEGDYDVFFNASSDRGETWGIHPIQLNSDGEDVVYAAFSPRIACSRSYVYVTWIYRDDLSNCIYFRSSLDSGKTWQQPVHFLSPLGPVSFSNHQISSAEENVSVVWESREEGKTGGAAIYYNFSTDSGIQWQLYPIRLDIGQNIYPNESIKPQLVCQKGHIYAVWEDMRNGFYEGHWGGWLGADVYFNSADLLKPYFTLTTNSGNQGSIEPGPGSYMCPPDSLVNIEAFPNDTYQFTHWTGSVQGTENPIQITMDSDTIIQANFDRLFNLTIELIGGGVTHPSYGVHSYRKDTVVVITAVPHKYYQFTGWSGDLTGSMNPASIIMDSDKTVQVHFQHCVYAPSNFTGSLVENRSLFFVEYIHILKWEANPYNENIVKYRLYLIEAAGHNLLNEIPAGQFEFRHRGIDKNKTYAYVLKAVDESGREGDPAQLNMK